VYKWIRGASFADIGGLGDQVGDLRGIIEPPVLNRYREPFQGAGNRTPKGALLYGPPGTGKTILTRTVTAILNTNFLKVISSTIVDKYTAEVALCCTRDDG